MPTEWIFRDQYGLITDIIVADTIEDAVFKQGEAERLRRAVFKQGEAERLRRAESPEPSVDEPSVDEQLDAFYGSRLYVKGDDHAS